jgi:hypothetical protein
MEKHISSPKRIKKYVLSVYLRTYQPFGRHETPPLFGPRENTHRTHFTYGSDSFHWVPIYIRVRHWMRTQQPECTEFSPNQSVELELELVLSCFIFVSSRSPMEAYTTFIVIVTNSLLPCLQSRQNHHHHNQVDGIY